MGNILHLGVLSVFYLMDGLVWLLAYWLIPTGFFGIPAKASGRRRMIFASVLLLTTVTNVLVYVVLREKGIAVAGTGSLVSLFCLVYWMFYLQEPRRIKRFLILLVTDTFVSTVLILTSCLLSFVRVPEKIWQRVALNLSQQLLVIGVICLLSWFSARRRKTPMKFFHIMSICVFCMLIQFVLSAFEVQGYEEAQAQVHVYLQVVLPFFRDDGGNIMSFAILVALAVVMSLFLIMIVRESESDYFRKKNAVSEYYLETQKEHYASLTQSNREIRKIKHDMKNHIYCLQELYNSENYEELGRYLSDMDENIRHADAGVHVGNEIADAIIAEKQGKAAKKGIVLEVDGDMSGVELSAIDVCTIFSNIIDNGIEAVEGLSEPDKKVVLEIRKNRNFLLISERNPVKHKPEIQDNQIMTTKKDKENHGFGIVNVKEAAAKYDGECLIDVTDAGNGYEFKIQVMLPV